MVRHFVRHSVYETDKGRTTSSLLALCCAQELQCVPNEWPGRGDRKSWQQAAQSADDGNGNTCKIEAERRSEAASAPSAAGTHSCFTLL